MPFFGIYSATKRFNKVFGYMNAFSYGCGPNARQFKDPREAKSSLDFMVYQPGECSTRMNNFRKDRLSAPPQDSAHGALRDLGQKWHTNGALIHSCLNILVNYTPAPVAHLTMLQTPQNGLVAKS